MLTSRPCLDSITLAGSGEPTLARSLGPVLSFIKREYPEYTLSVLTNGSLLADRDVQKELLPADRVIPTLTTAFQKTFERIHNPHPSLKIDAIIRGMEEFRARYRGALWLEVFVVPGLNTTEEELAGLRSAIDRIEPDCVQLNTVDRPPAEDWVEPATEEELERVSRRLGRPDTALYGRRLPISPAMHGMPRSINLILRTLQRRPSTVEDLVRTTGMSGGEVVKVLGALEHAGKITSQRMGRGIFYRICRKEEGGEEKI